MFKFVLCALYAVAVADPQWLTSPTFTELLTPVSTTVTRVAGINDPYNFGIAHLIKKRAAPLLDAYVTPSAYVNSGWAPYSYLNSYLPYSPVQYAHLIKKRSAGLITPFSYIAPTPLATGYSSTLLNDVPLVSSYVTPAHLIKKRSAAWVAPGSYVAPAAVSTYVAPASLAAAAILPSDPYWSGYAGIVPFIKK